MPKIRSAAQTILSTGFEDINISCNSNDFQNVKSKIQQTFRKINQKYVNYFFSVFLNIFSSFSPQTSIAICKNPHKTLGKMTEKGGTELYMLQKWSNKKNPNHKAKQKRTPQKTLNR